MEKELNLKNIFQIVAVLILIAVGVIYYLNKDISEDNLYEENNLENEIISVNDEVTTETNEESQVINYLLSEKYLIEVSWKENPEYLEKIGTDFGDNYLVGSITNGELKDEKLYLLAEQGMGTTYRFYIIKDNEKIYLTGYYGPDYIKNWEIDGIDNLPEAISLPETSHILTKGWPSLFFTRLNIKKKIFTDEVLGDIYLSSGGCLFARLPDGRAINYDLKVDFSEDDIIPIIFNDGKSNDEEYEYKKSGESAGCGAFCVTFSDVSDSIPNIEQKIKEVGRTSGGDVFYELVNSSDQRLVDLYNDKNTVAFYNTENGYKKMEQNKYSYEEFLGFKPLLYWKDPLGRWIEFTNKRFIIAAEKCKPAIYLYPEENTILNVQVTPNIKFTKTIPEYPVGGWNVKAFPNGNILDLKTGLNFDYLYWSGLVIDYPVEKDLGWVVEKNNIEEFLDDKLSVLGLNEKEISDFKEYWMEKLSEKPYYQISFVSRYDIDRLSPLKISPIQPNNVIRVLMTAKGLDEFKLLKEQILPPTPIRNGFVVAEWGGVLLR